MCTSGIWAAACRTGDERYRKITAVVQWDPPNGFRREIRQVTYAFTVFDRPGDDLVIDVGDIAHIVNVQPPVAQVSGNKVKHDHDPCMPDMT